MSHQLETPPKETTTQGDENDAQILLRPVTAIFDLPS